MAVPVGVEIVTEALKILITPRGSEPPGTDKQAALLSSLGSNVSSLEEKLLNSPEWKALGDLRDKVLAESKWLEECSELAPESHWRFTLEALLLLLCLKEVMIAVAASFTPPKPNLRTPEAAPALSPDTLSISQQKSVQSVLQFVVSMGICPYLLPGIGLPLQQRSEFGALVHRMVSCDVPIIRTRRLYICCTTLLEVSRHPSLGSLLLTNHLGDLMAGLCQLGFCPTKAKTEQNTSEKLKELTESERVRCKEALRGLLDQVYQPLVVRELLILQGGPKQGTSPGVSAKVLRAPAPAWLRRLIGQLLSERLMKPNGVQAVVRGILEGAGAGPVGGCDAEAAASNWKKCDAVARVLASCPQQSFSVEEYYQKVCPQILDLLHIQNAVTARQFQRVATETFLTMGREQPPLAEKYLFLPMLEPLLRCTRTHAEDLPQPGETLVSEKELSQCVEDIVKVFVVGNNPTSAVLHFTQQVLSAVFCLYCFTRQNVSHLRSPCQDILMWFFEKSARETAVAALAGLAGLDSSLPTMPTYCQMKPASLGGAIITIQENRIDDDDNALYEKVSWEQWKTQCLVELLSISPGSSLAADFFLFCLKKLTPLTDEEEGEDQDSSSCETLLDLEKKLTLRDECQERRLQLLQVLSVLCERISDSVFTDIQQVVDFVAVTLERSCTRLMVSEGGTVVSQTLSMCMGLVAAMLGGAVKLTSPDFEHLKKLLPVLERVSLTHPEPVIQELASDLRISIATHCSVPLPPRTCAGQASAQAKKEPESRVSEPCDFQEILGSAQHSDVPTRAAALRTLTRLLEQRHPQALEHREKLLQLCLANLEEEDPFVYLSAIQGIAVLSGEFPDRVFPVLLAHYGDAAPADSKLRTPESRMKVGEALMRCTRAMGDLIFQYRDTLIHAFLRGCKDQDSTLRASSLSNLGELCQHLQFSLGPVIQEVSSCLSAIVRTDPEAQVRRAAIHVVVLLLRGLGEKATEVLRDVSLDLYRLLKFVVRCESDSVSVLHAQLGLEELDGIIRTALLPPQKLEKKIIVLP
ncbi:transport and Golgi organization protein 6 homolog [Spea bombifrons]|uniref:transport and Golgi organization protein 6 homolog n=1 Tax=Spea bombifrons TaxID=233779 RepID=UPI00234AC2F6|nr:transport and Golgi organization protein 6 homolog [Spea bombifrons]